jgi:hypothetical protein
MVFFVPGIQYAGQSGDLVTPMVGFLPSRIGRYRRFWHGKWAFAGFDARGRPMPGSAGRLIWTPSRGQIGLWTPLGAMLMKPAYLML